jgi:hypothetical protein
MRQFKGRTGEWLVGLSMASIPLACGDGAILDAERAWSESPGEVSPANDASDEGGPGGSLELLAEIHIDHFGISFLSEGTGPEASVLIATGTSCRLALPCDRRDPVTRLEAKYEPLYGPLTHLELFMALAPGVEPPAALVASHALEAFDAGREDDDVMPIEPLVVRLSGSERGLLPIRTIAALEVEGSSYRFKAAGVGADAMVFLTLPPGGDGLSALTRLALAYGDLTLLETFLTLAPDSEPPEALVATHATEVARMGTRDDESVRANLTLPPAE